MIRKFKLIGMELRGEDPRLQTKSILVRFAGTLEPVFIPVSDFGELKIGAEYQIELTEIKAR